MCGEDFPFYMNRLTEKLSYKGNITAVSLLKEKKKVIFFLGIIFCNSDLTDEMLRLSEILNYGSVFLISGLWYVHLYCITSAELSWSVKKRLPCIQHPRSPTVCVVRSSDEFVIFCWVCSWLEVSYILVCENKVSHMVTLNVLDCIMRCVFILPAQVTGTCCNSLVKTRSIHVCQILCDGVCIFWTKSLYSPSLASKGNIFNLL